MKICIKWKNALNGKKGPACRKLQTFPLPTLSLPSPNSTNATVMSAWLVGSARGCWQWMLGLARDNYNSRT